MHRFDTESPIRKGRRDHFVICESIAELARLSEQSGANKKIHGTDWTGHKSHAESVTASLVGDASLVAPSDALLSRFEDMNFATSRRDWMDDVCGAVPNVPAFLAGVPTAMRRRRREDSSASSPIAVIVDLTTSAALTSENIQRRGAAILALVRILTNKRPVELWAGTAFDAFGSHASFIFAKLDTTPLDLSVAAFVLTHAGFPRNVCYSTGIGLLGFEGHWPYNQGRALTSDEMAKCLAPAFSHVTETLCLTGLHSNDLSVTNPAAWVEKMVAQLTPASLEDA